MLQFFLSALLVFDFGSVFGNVTGKKYLLMPELFHYDDYDRCTLYGPKFLYCTFTFKLYPEDPNNKSETWEVIEEINSDPINYRHDRLRHGICVPESIDINLDSLKNTIKVSKKLEEFYNDKYRHKGLKGEIIEMNCESHESPYETNVYDDLFSLFCVVNGAILLIATFLDVLFINEAAETNFSGSVILALSVRKNWQRLMSADSSSNPGNRSLRSFNIIRTILLLIIILSHTVGSFLRGPVSNPAILEQSHDNNGYFLGFDGDLSMQIFILMSCGLLTYSFFLQFENCETIKFGVLIKLFIKRYIRFTPVVFFMVAFSATRMAHLGRGPMWDFFVGTMHKRCRKNWWVNLLYLNNYIRVEEMCLLQSWAITVNMQIYVISLLLLWLIRNHENRIWLILGGPLFVQILYLFFSFYLNNWPHKFPPGIEYIYASSFVKSKLWTLVRISIISNLTGAIFGIVFGYIFYKLKNKPLFEKKHHTSIAWIIIRLLLLAFNFVDQFIFEDPLYSAIYGSVRRIIFNAIVASILLLLTQSDGRFTRWICQSRTLHVLGRLSFAALLIHPLTENIEAGFRRFPVHLDEGKLLPAGLKDLTVSLIAAIFLNLFIDMPLAELNKLFIYRPINVKKRN